MKLIELNKQHDDLVDSAVKRLDQLENVYDVSLRRLTRFVDRGVSRKTHYLTNDNDDHIHLSPWSVNQTIDSRVQSPKILASAKQAWLSVESAVKEIANINISEFDQDDLERTSKLIIRVLNKLEPAAKEIVRRNHGKYVEWDDNEIPMSSDEAVFRKDHAYFDRVKFNLIGSLRQNSFFVHPSATKELATKHLIYIIKELCPLLYSKLDEVRAAQLKPVTQKDDYEIV